jgi:hypothetical protein
MGLVKEHASRILWIHYLLILIVPLAIARKRELAAWAVAGSSFWVLMIGAPPPGGYAWAMCTTLGVIALWSTSRRRRTVAGSSTVEPNVDLAAEVA